MQVDVLLNEELVAQAKKYCGIEDLSSLVQLALTLLVEQEAARELSKQAGRASDVVNVGREHP